ncbi:MAG: ribosome silencing factor [Candidatus Brocadiae bacterium]|nr:ribosome silencing factor [Candidatus Brocadiia bacterium]
MESKELVSKIVKILDDNKAQDIVVLNLVKHLDISDYFVICSGLTQKHVQSLADKVEMELKKDKLYSFGKEGYRDAKWVLMDYGDAIVHFYQEEARKYYDIEDFWGDAPRIPVTEFHLG